MKSLVVIAGLLVFWGPSAMASWATPADADYSVENENVEFTVYKDGTFKGRSERTVQVLKESARTSLGVIHHYYDPEAEEVKFLKGYTENDGKRTPVDAKFVEDKPTATNIDGFDSRNQTTVVFPDVKVGSKIFEATERKVKKLPVKNFYSQRFYFGLGEYVKQGHIRIRSGAPLFFSSNDPMKKLEVKQVKDGSWFVTDITLTSPIYARVLHEKNVFISDRQRTWVVVSNVKSYADVLPDLAKKYEDVVNSPLPPEYQKIADTALKFKTTVERLNSVTSQLAELVRYVGDWREIKGAYEPHSLDTIVKTKFGDCKDFAVSAAAILRKLGYKTNVVAVERGHSASRLPALPLMAAFNHAMVRYEDGGKVRWLDPTNFQSFAQGIFEDVAGHDVVVLDPARVRVEKIDGLEAAGSKVETKMDLDFDQAGDVSLSGSMSVQGRAAVPLTGANLFATKEEMSYQIATAFFPDQNLKSYQVDGVDFTSRIVSDITLKLRMIAKNSSLKTTAGYALRLPGTSIVSTLSDLDAKTRVSDLDVDNPMTEDLMYKLENVKLVGNKIHGCNLESPWVNASLKISQKGNTIVVQDHFTINQSVISVDDLKTKDFEKFQSRFKDCFENVAVVYLPVGHKGSRLRALSSVKAE